MAIPSVHPTTMRLWLALPEHYRIADARQIDPDYPLLRYLSLIGDQLGELEDLVDRINYVPPPDGPPGDTSDLVDPATADAAWLPWIAQLTGARLPLGLDEAATRAVIAAAPSGWRVGTKQAIADAAKSVLAGGKYVVITDHYHGNPFQIEVRTRTSETPSPEAVIAAIVAAGAKPAGHQLVSTSYGASWAEIATRFPKWADIVGHTWLDVLETSSAPADAFPVADTIEVRWKVRAHAADTLELRWKVLGANNPVSDTIDVRWKVRQLRLVTVTAGGISPLIYLDFNDAAGTNANDSSVNNRDGTYWPLGVTLNQAGLIPANGVTGRSVLLDGNTSGDGGVITTNYTPFDAGSQRTYRGVCKRLSHVNRHALFGSDGASIMAAVAAGNNDVNFWPDTGAASASWPGAWPGDNVVTEWVIKYDDAAHTAELLINGVSKGIVNSLATYASNTAKLTIGGRAGVAFGFTLDAFHGNYDAFDIVDGLTSNTRLAADYAAAF
jgi:hypothetical protein